MVYIIKIVILYTTCFVQKNQGTYYRKERIFLMNILVINAGSSSLKYQLFDMDKEAVLAKGLCERCLLYTSRGFGAHVIVTEVDPVKASEAMMDGFRVMPMEEAAKTGDLFITATGCRDIITSAHFPLLKDGAVLCNAGHFNVEVDVQWLEENAAKKPDQKPNIMGLSLIHI